MYVLLELITLYRIRVILKNYNQVNEMEELIAQLVPSASDDEADQGDDDRTKEE